MSEIKVATNRKSAFYIIHGILLLIAIEGVLTWRTEQPDGSIYIDPTGIALLPLVILSVLRFKIGRTLLLLYSALQVMFGFSLLISGHPIIGVVSIGFFGFICYMLDKWKSEYSALGLFSQKYGRQEFECEIKEQEEHLFGVHLYNEGIKLHYQDDPATLEISERHYSEIMERGRIAIKEAKCLLEKVKMGQQPVSQFRNFRFPVIHGMPASDEMNRRARLLVKAYNTLFPGRPKDQPLTAREVAQLTEHAADQYYGS